MLKTYLKQILSGVHACHCNRIMHRDLKPQNILVGQDGLLKIADFGLARAFSVPLRPLTQEVVTIWYRAPEIFLGSPEYTIAVDMWSVGCIFYEMIKLVPLFQASEDIEMIDRIFSVLGTPNDQMWPGFSQLPNVLLFSALKQY
jgi:serine/threonine protein kinase